MRLLKIKIIALVLLTSSISFAQLPSKVLVGYWENWGTLRLKDVDDRYNILCLAFLEADKNFIKTDNKISDLEFDPNNNNGLKNDIPIVQAEGKKVLISIGGGNGSFRLNNASDKNKFVTKVKEFITEYGVDGIDIDLEQKEYVCAVNNSAAKINNPTDIHITNLIDGIKDIMEWYQNKYGKKMILTMAPETAYVNGGLSSWAVNNICGGHYLAIIEQLRDELDLLMVQLYNSGSILDLNGKEHFENSVDFVISATETIIRGFTAAGNKLGKYSGLPEEKVVVGLTTCASDEAVRSKSEIISIINYLTGKGPKPGSYTLKSYYPNLKGLMTWSINTDAGISTKKSCNPSVSYEFAQAFEDIYGTIKNSVESLQMKSIEVFPNPTTQILTINSENLIGKKFTLININGKVVFTFKPTEKLTKVDLSKYSKGIYTLKSENHLSKVIVK
mgnify:CR=1 FL=1